MCTVLMHQFFEVPCTTVARNRFLLQYLHKQTGFEMQIPFKKYSSLLAEYLEQQRLRVLVLAGAIFVSVGLRLANPQFIRIFIDRARAQAPLSTLTRIALVFIGLMIFQQIVTVLVTYLGELVGWTSTNELRQKLLEHTVRLDMTFHNRHTPGEMIERIDGDITVLGNFFSQFAIQIGANLILLIGAIVLIGMEDWRAGLAMTGYVILAFLVVARLRNIAVPHWKKSRGAAADFFGFLEEHLAATEDIRSCDAKAHVLRRFFDLIRKWKRKDQKAALMALIVVNTNRLLFTLGNVLALSVSAALFLRGHISFGVAFLIIQYMNLMRQPIMNIVLQMDNLQQAAASIERTDELLQESSRVQNTGTRTLPAGPVEVSFENLHFAYQEGTPVLSGLDFHLPRGESLGVLGRTGSGKTTISRLLYRLYDTSSGGVRLNGYPINSFDILDMRSRVGLVSQRVQLFNASVRDNLTLFDPAISGAVLSEAIRELGLSPWLASLPDGLDTILRPNGLSAGQAQLLAFCRILVLKDPGLIILDEASSRLDPATENIVENAIARLMQNRTAIIIAHRLSTVRKVDRVLILENGSILESGRRSDLIAQEDSQLNRLLRAGAFTEAPA
jgi:ATP-binding cassette, subfamily B, bacterial